MTTNLVFAPCSGRSKPAVCSSAERSRPGRGCGPVRTGVPREPNSLALHCLKVPAQRILLGILEPNVVVILFLDWRHNVGSSGGGKHSPHHNNNNVAVSQHPAVAVRSTALWNSVQRECPNDLLLRDSHQLPTTRTCDQTPAASKKIFLPAKPGKNSSASHIGSAP